MLASKVTGKPVAASRRNVPAFTGIKPTGRVLSVQVYAKKGKTAFRRQMGVPGQQMVQAESQAPPVPEVDPENVEFVVFTRAKKYVDPTTGKQMQNSPWIPLSIVKGGQSANFLVKIMESDWGNKLYGKTLIRNIAGALYKDRADIEKQLRKRYPPFATVASKDFEYGFKIRDKEDPKAWSKAENVVVCPPEEELGATGLEQVRKFFSMENLQSMFTQS